jgi:hypothetical protein
MSEKYILGSGVFAINSVDVALTRGGGQFVVERNYKQVEADGDYGPVKGRIRKDGSVARLTIRAMEVIATTIPEMYPAMEVDSTTVPTTDTITAKIDIEDADYYVVTWTGKTAGGRDVIIEITDAINLGNLDWSLIDKDEVIPELVYTGAYDPTTRTVEPWNIKFVDPA